MSEKFTDRTEMMLGKDACDRLASSRVAIFGIGGVGGFATEALARAGVGEIHLIDSDKVSVSNINRQIIATHRTVGQYKTEAAKERILSINPDAHVVCHNVFYTGTELDISGFDYIIDAIDSVGSKVALITEAKEKEVRIISAMGAGNKLDPTAFKVADISKTAVCPLAKAVRVALRKKGINHLKVVYSEELPFIPVKDTPQDDRGRETINELSSSKAPDAKENYDRRTPPGSLSFVPSVMGLILAGEVIKDISFSV